MGGEILFTQAIYNGYCDGFNSELSEVLYKAKGFGGNVYVKYRPTDSVYSAIITVREEEHMEGEILFAEVVSRKYIEEFNEDLQDVLNRAKVFSGYTDIEYRPTKTQFTAIVTVRAIVENSNSSSGVRRTSIF